MAGLGFANPEAHKGQRLALMNGAASIPAYGQTVSPSQMQGGAHLPTPSAQSMPAPPVNPAGGQPTPPYGSIGAPQAAMQAFQAAQSGSPGTAPGAPGTDPEAPPEDDGPEWYKVAGAIGHVLLSIDAGYHGRGMPEGPEAEWRAQQDQEMQLQEFVINTVAQGWEASRKAPLESREEILGLYEAAIKKVAPEFDFRGFIKKLESDGDRVDALAPQLATFSPEAKSLFMARVRSRGGDPAAAAADAVKDPDFMKQLQDYDDNKNAAPLKFKLHKIRAAMKQLGMADDAFADLSPDDLSRINDLLPENSRLTPSELATLRRKPEYGTIIGMKPPPQPGLDREAGYRSDTPRARPPQAGADDDLEDGGLDDAPPPADPPRRSPPPRSAPTPRRAPQGPKPPARPTAKPRAGAATPNSAADQLASKRPGWKPPEKGASKIQRGASSTSSAANLLPNRAVKPRAPVKMEMTAEMPGVAPAKKAAPAAAPAKRERRIVVPKDTNIPGFGKAKKGDVLIYDYETGQYRRGK